MQSGLPGINNRQVNGHMLSKPDRPRMPALLVDNVKVANAPKVNPASGLGSIFDVEFSTTDVRTLHSSKGGVVDLLRLRPAGESGA